MIPGYNHNVRYRDQVYHVQTEDSGLKNPVIITHLFLGGTILATQRCSYADLVDAEGREPAVRARMQDQHKAMLRNVVSGSMDHVLERFAVHEAKVPDGTSPSGFHGAVAPGLAGAHLDEGSLELVEPTEPSRVVPAAAAMEPPLGPIAQAPPVAHAPPPSPARYAPVGPSSPVTSMAVPSAGAAPLPPIVPITPVTPVVLTPISPVTPVVLTPISPAGPAIARAPAASTPTPVVLTPISPMSALGAVPVSSPATAPVAGATPAPRAAPRAHPPLASTPPDWVGRPAYAAVAAPVGPARATSTQGASAPPSRPPASPVAARPPPVSLAPVRPAAPAGSLPPGWPPPRPAPGGGSAPNVTPVRPIPPTVARPPTGPLPASPQYPGAPVKAPGAFGGDLVSDISLDDVIIRYLEEELLEDGGIALDPEHPRDPKKGG